MNMHGGDVWQVAEELGGTASELLDFSANINPRGLPARALLRLARDAANPQLLSFYPDPAARNLRRALASRHRVPVESIVVGPGAEALLNPILRYLRCRRLLSPVPAFSEYRRVCEQLNIHYVPFALHYAEQFRLHLESFCRRVEDEEFDAVLVNNPHNPSGAMLEAAEVRQLLAAVRASGAALLLDEAFIDYAERESLVREAAAQPGLIVLRSLTKFYGCPALRVGYAVTHPDDAHHIAGLLPTWPVTQLALDALTEALGDQAYAEETLRANVANREQLVKALLSLELNVFPSAANYLLLELKQHGMPNSSQLRMRLMQNHRVLIRDCNSYEGLTHGRFVRVAVRSEEDNARLVQALAQELRHS